MKILSRVSKSVVLLSCFCLSGWSADPLMDEASFKREIRDPMEQSFLLTRTAIEAAPREVFSPAALVKSGVDSPVAAFEWVRDQTSPLPYLGVLRDPQGVQMNRSGNSLDRALLLDALLGEMGIEETRLVRAKLENSTAKELYTYWAGQENQSKEVIPVDEGFDREEVMQRISQTTGVDIQTLGRQFEDAQLEYQMMWSEMMSSIEIQAQLLPDMLQAELLVPDESVEARHIEAFRDHWWLEVKLDGVWTAMDPVRRDSRPGDTLSDQALTRIDPADLPDDLYHRLEIAVIAEQWSEGQLTERPALQQVFRSASLSDRYLQLKLIPARGNPLDKFAGSASDPVELRNTLYGLDEWLPVLKVGEETIFEASIRSNGEINESPNAPPTVRALGHALSALDQLGGPNKKETELSAVRVEFTVHRPGKKPETKVRYFSDILGPALRSQPSGNWEVTDVLRKRRALEMLGGMTLMTISGIPSEHWVNVHFFQALADNIPGLTGVLRGALLNQSEASINGFKKLQHFPMDLFGIAAVRADAHPGNTIPFPDGLNLFARFEVMRDNPSSERLYLHQMYDWIRHDVEVPPGTEYPAHVRFVQGIVDTHLEEYLTRGVQTPETAGINAAQQFGQDLLTGLEWIRVASPDQLQSLADEFTPDQLARFAAVLEQGHQLLVRPKPLTIGSVESPLWWSYAPADGSVLGYALDGRGTEASEYLEIATVIFTAVDALIGVALCSGLEGGAYACCVAEVGLRSGLGMGFGAVLAKATTMSAMALYYAGVGFSAASAATGQLSFCN